jgi:hypothetical protein
MLADDELQFTDCPECGFPALVEHRFAVRSTEGPVSHAVTLCLKLHRLCTAEEPPSQLAGNAGAPGAEGTVPGESPAGDAGAP